MYRLSFAYIVIILLLFGCSTKKNTPSTRAYHELTTRYNVFFNAQSEYEERMKMMFDGYVDDWQTTLPMFPNSKNRNDTTEKKIGGPFDVVVEKTTKAIQEHSITSKPKRDRDKMNSHSYRDWLRQNEFNPFIDQAWLLLGKAHLQNQDYIESISVFANTIRLFGYDLDVVSEAQIWLVRAYTEIGWYSDAEVLVEGLLARTVPDNLKTDFANFYAFLLLQQNKQEEAIDWLIEAVAKEKNSVQRRRLWYLIGQMYASADKKHEAYDAFDKVRGLTTPNDVSLSALVAQSGVADGNNNTVNELTRPAKRAKNEQYLDLIYGAIGDFYLLQNDTVRAVDNYIIAENKSIRNGIEKAYVQERLGNIFFTQKKYVDASSRYAEALTKLSPSHSNYKEVQFRANVLGEMAPLYKKKSEQDSLLRLSRLPYEEQVKMISSHISELKSMDKIVAPVLNDETTFRDNIGSPIGTFYFYNPQQVLSGRREFNKQWGDRKLQDNWRLNNKLSTVLTDEVNNDTVDSAGTEVFDKEDIFSIDYYLQQLPTTEHDIAKCNEIISSSLVDIGDIARTKLYDYGLAIDSYQQVVDNFADTPDVLNALYKLCLIHRQIGDVDMSNTYKHQLVLSFPESEYTTLLTDLEYEDVMSNFSAKEAQLYKNTFEAYQNGHMSVVRNNYDKSYRLFRNGNLMPKFKLLNALSYAFEGDSDSLKIELSDLVSLYPNGLEATLSKHIIEGLSQGMSLVDNASILMDMQFGSSESDVGILMNHDSVMSNIDNRLRLHTFMILFDENTQKKSDLLFAISNHNFSTYQLRTFTANMIRFGNTNALMIKPFNSYYEAMKYSDNVRSDSVFRNSLSDTIRTFIISEDNYGLIVSEGYLSQLMEMDSVSVDIIEPLSNIETGNLVLGVDEPVADEIVDDYVIPKAIVPRKESVSIDQQLHELEQRQEKALSQIEDVASDKEKQRLIKQREDERKKLLKLRQKELKERERVRTQELKQRERDRKKRINEQEKIRQTKLKERAKQLRQQNR